MGRFDAIKARLMELAEEREDIRAAIEIGSQTREDLPADQYSDLDIILVTSQPEEYLYGYGAVSRLGEAMISFVEPTLAGAKERRMLFEGSLDVDMVVITPEQLERAAATGELGPILARGYRVLLDRMGAAVMISSAPPAVARGYIPAEDFWNAANDFWFHIVWTAKKLLRGELYTAVMCMDGYLQHLLLGMVELHEKCRHGEQYDVWHNGRLLEHWAGEDVTGQLKGCFARYGCGDIASALKAAAELYSQLALACAEALGHPYPDRAERTARQLLQEMLAK